MATKVLACALWIDGGHILLQYEGSRYSLPRIEVSDEETNEVALTNFFRGMGWMIAVGSLGYMVEEIANGSKALHLVFSISIIKRGTTNDNLILTPLSKLNELEAEPSILFKKILADSGSSRPTGCVTLVSW